MKWSAGIQLHLVPVDSDELGHLDVDWYDRFRSDMAVRGWAFVADLEYLQGPMSSLARTMIRSMRSEDGIIVAGCYQLKHLVGRQVSLLMAGLFNLRLIAAPKHFVHAMRLIKVIDLQTEFDDGRHLLTSSGEFAGTLASPPSVERKIFPKGTPVATLIAYHSARVKEILAADRTVQPVVMTSLGDLLRSEQRQMYLRSAYRESLAWITRDELLNLSQGNKHLSDAVFAEVQKIVIKHSPEP